jgi:hypothetical protein
VIRFLLRQVVAQLPRTPNDIYEEYQRFKQDAHKVMLERSKFETMLNSSLRELSKLCSSSTCLLLDEYDEFRNEKAEACEKAALRKCLSEISTEKIARIFITTRTHCVMELESNLIGAHTFEYKGSLVDVTQYVDQELDFLKCGDKTKSLIRSTMLAKNKEPMYISCALLSLIHIDFCWLPFRWDPFGI